MPKITRADVLRARQAFRAVAEIPEWERIARETFGDAEVDAPSSTARPAAKIAAIWAKMDPAERSEFPLGLILLGNGHPARAARSGRRKAHIRGPLSPPRRPPPERPAQGAFG